MKKYEKPSVQVIELQLKENIASVPTTVYKSLTAETATSPEVFQMALSEENIGFTAPEAGIVS